MTKIYPNLDKMCRLCLAEAEDEDAIAMVEIFPKLRDKLQPSIPIRIMACLALEAQSTDGLPQSICNECRYQLEKSYYFRKRCQAADNKLRKHLRLLNLGKVSNVFNKTEEEAFEDELQFEDSISFLKEKDSLREARERQHFNTRLENEIILCEERLREKLRAELEPELRESLKQDCLEVAKQEVRNEVEDQCHQEELNVLLIDLETFLLERRRERNLVKQTVASVTTEEKRVNPKRKKQNSETEKPAKWAKIKFGEHNQVANTVDIEETIQSYSVVRSEANDEAGEDHDTDFYIVEETEEQMGNDQEQDNETVYTAEIEEEEEFQTTSESGTEKANSTYATLAELEFLKQVSVSESSQQADEDNEEELEFNIAQDEISYHVVADTELSKKHHSDSAESAPFTKSRTENGDSSPKSTDAVKAVIARQTDTPKTFKCHLCPMVFSTQLSFTRHQKNHEKTFERGVSFECSECHILLSCKSALTRHMMIHTGNRPFSCTVCKKSFVQREILKRHMDTHTGERRFRCTQCHRSFSQKVNLKQHINKCHLDVPVVQQHVCHLCPKRFNHQSGLSRHLAQHSGVAFQCAECFRTFGDRSSVRRHVANVHGGGSIGKTNNGNENASNEPSENEKVELLEFS